MTAIVSFYLIAILAQRVRSHSLQERNVLMALNAVLVLRTRIEKCSASEFQKTLTFKMMLHMLGAEPFLWKWVLFAWEWKMISISKAEHLPSFCSSAMSRNAQRQGYVVGWMCKPPLPQEKSPLAPQLKSLFGDSCLYEEISLSQYFHWK